LEVHHIVPLAKGGAEFELSNLTTLCRDCHAKVGRGQGARDDQRRHTRKPDRGETHSRSETENNFIPGNDLEPLVG